MLYEINNTMPKCLTYVLISMNHAHKHFIFCYNWHCMIWKIRKLNELEFELEPIRDDPPIRGYMRAWQ